MIIFFFQKIFIVVKFDKTDDYDEYASDDD